MDTQEIDGRERSLGVLAISYLFWHLFSAAIGVALLAFTTLTYAGVIEVATALPGSVDIAGASVSALVVIPCVWVVAALDALFGVAFGVCSLLARTRHALLGRAILLGRVMFAFCLAYLLVAFATSNATSLLSTAISLVLVGSLSLALRRFEDLCGEQGECQRTPARTFMVDAADDVPAHEADVDEVSRPTFRLVSGYASIMLAWGALRILMGLSALFSAPHASRAPAAISILVLGALIVAAGAYLVFVGRLGKRALVGGSSLRALVWGSAAGIAVSASTLVLFVVWAVLGLTPDGLLVFSAAVDLLLYAAGLFYAGRLRKVVEKKS